MTRVTTVVLALFVAAIMPTSAALPAKRPAKHAWETEAPTAETVRRMHEMLQHDGEPLSEEETAASFEAFLEARGGRFAPIWENHTHAERTANLQHHAPLRSERRRAQATTAGTNLFADATAEEKESSLVAMLDPVDVACDDPLATNTCLLYTSPSPRDKRQSRMPSSA